MHDLEFEHLHVGTADEPLNEVAWAADNVELTTVGIDIGSSTSHLMFARVHLQRLGTALSSRFVVVGRKVLWKSPILLTPYLPDYTIDVDELAGFIGGCYAYAGIERDEIDSGAVILTGEAIKRRNARAIADLFSEEAGKFVCASAGHHMESQMAAHGSGAIALSRGHNATLLNVDIGGGTTKFALIENGRILATCAIAVGGRLIVEDETSGLARIEPPAEAVAHALGTELALGKPLPPDDRKRLAARMARLIMGLIDLRPPELARLAQVDPPHDQARHARGEALAVVRGERLAERKLGAERMGDRFRRRLDARQSTGFVFDDQAAADGDRAGREDAAVLDQGELGGAAADVDIEQRGIAAARQRDGARAVRRHLAFHVVAGGGADELAGLLGEQIGDGARIAALERLPGQDDGAAIDRLALDAGVGVAAADEPRELVDVDRIVAPVGREQDRRLPENLPLDHHEAARQGGRQPLQVHAREHQMRGGGADIDADGGQLDVVGGPGNLVDRGVVGIDVKVLEFEIVHRTSRADSLQSETALVQLR